MNNFILFSQQIMAHTSYCDLYQDIIDKDFQNLKWYIIHTVKLFYDALFNQSYIFLYTIVKTL